MGYKIIYSEERENRRKSKVIPLTLLFLSIFMGWTFRNWDQGREVVLDVLFPVSGVHAGEALEVMAEQLKAGENIKDTVTEFCRSVFPGHIEGPY